MAVGFGLLAVHPQDDAAQVTDQFFLDTPFLREFVDEVNGRSDQPEDSSLDWIDGLEYGEPISAEDCYPPDEVLRSLEWLRDLAGIDDPAARRIWRRHYKEPYSPEGFARRAAHDLEGLIALCRNARARQQLVVGVLVP